MTDDRAPLPKNFRRHPWQRVAVGIMTAYFGVCVGIIFSPKKDPSAKTLPSGWTHTYLGQPAPQFRITATDGHVFDLAAPHDSPILLTFFATWCGPCERELTRLESEVMRNRRGKRLRVLAISIDDPDPVLRKYWANKGLTFSVASDARGIIFPKYAQSGVPRTYLINAQGILLYQSLGYRSEEFPHLVQAIDAELDLHP